MIDEFVISDQLLEQQFGPYLQDSQEECIAYVEGGLRCELAEVKKCCEMVCRHCQKPMSCCGLDIWNDDFGSPLKMSEYHIAACTNPDCSRPKKAKKVIESKTDWTTIGVPNNCIGKSYERRNKICEENITAGKKFLASNFWGLLLHGTSGNGKTLFAIELLKAYHRKFGFGCHFLYVSKFFEELRTSMGTNENEYHILRRYGDCTFLVFDDIGANRGTEWQIERCYELLESRAAANRKTVVTTNLNAGELEEIYGKRLTRRLKDNGAAIEFKTHRIEPRAYKDHG